MRAHTDITILYIQQKDLKGKPVTGVLIYQGKLDTVHHISTLSINAKTTGALKSNHFPG